MLLKQHQAQDPESEDIQMIVNEATRCRYIMRGLLDFARQSRVVKTKTNLEALIREVVANLSLKAQGTGITVSCQIEDQLPELMLDGEQIRQMLTNLVQNGMDAVQGQGEVTVSAGIAAAEGWVILRVRDTGVGMPQEVISQLFTPFFTTKQLGKGTGMGLAIVYGVVKMHSGDITVESAVGRGTTFLIRLPLVEKAKEESA
jgi:signal transduction histidine kinase